MDELSLHVHKALAFVRKMLEYLAKNYVPVAASAHPDRATEPVRPPAKASPVRWTGSFSDLTELLYGLHTLKCVNNEEAGINELLFHFSDCSTCK